MKNQKRLFSIRNIINVRKKIKAFFHIFLNSLFPNHNYYNKIKQVNLFFSIKYFLSLILIGCFLVILIFTFNNFIFRDSLGSLRRAIIDNLENFPEDLVITIKNNKLKTNYDRPYIFWLKNEKIVHPLIIFDERANEESLNQYNHGSFLITENKVVMKRNGKIYSLPLKADDIVIDKNNITFLKEIVDKNIQRFYYILPLIIFFSFIFLSGFFFFRSLFLLFLLSSFFYFVLRIKKKAVRYSNVLQIGLHSNTTPLIYELLIFIIVWKYKFLPGYFILSLIFLIAAVYEVYFSTHHQSHLRHQALSHHQFHHSSHSRHKKTNNHRS